MRGLKGWLWFWAIWACFALFIFIAGIAQSNGVAIGCGLFSLFGSLGLIAYYDRERRRINDLFRIEP